MQYTCAPRRLTPRQRFRQFEPSWFLRGHTTSLLASVIEKEDVKDVRCGIVIESAAHSQFDLGAGQVQRQIVSRCVRSRQCSNSRVSVNWVSRGRARPSHRRAAPRTSCGDNWEKASDSGLFVPASDKKVTGLVGSSVSMNQAEPGRVTVLTSEKREWPRILSKR